MDGAFDSQSRNFGELLGQYEKRPVVVPQFQRGYSWEKIHLAAFWEDLKTFHREKAQPGMPQKYFLGPIVILPDQNKVSLLDGQQRLATATILFSVIRDVLRSAAKGSKACDLARDIQKDLIAKDEAKECSRSNSERWTGRFSSTRSRTIRLWWTGRPKDFLAASGRAWNYCALSVVVDSGQ